MKKFLFPFASAFTVLAMTAAAPTLTPKFSGTITATQTVPSYSNPSAFDSKGALVITGAFNDTFEDYEAVGTSAFIVKYTADNAKAWTAALIGSASITSVTTDSDDNIYVAGIFADEVEFTSTNGTGQTKTGLIMNDAPTEKQNASFLAKYSADGVLEAVRTFVPEMLPELVETGMYFPEDGDVYFKVRDIKIDGDNLYIAASFTGETTIDEEKFTATYQDPWGGIYFIDKSGSAVYSLDTKTLTTCKKAAAFDIAGPVMSDDAPAITNLSFAVDGGKVYASAILSGIGTVNATNGDVTKEITLDGSIVNFIVTSDNNSVSLVKSVGESIKTYDNIADMLVNGSTLYMVGASDGVVPAVEVSDDQQKVTGSSDIFVATFNTADLTLNTVIANANDEGTSSIEQSTGDKEDKPNYELATSLGIAGDALYINTYVYNFNDELSSLASYWYDGAEYSDAPVAATGVATAAELIALPVSDATKVDYSIYNVASAGISGIVSDVDVPVEYYNIQGIRVAEPANGIYILRQGNKVEKHILK